ncbi:hypothetical protein DPX16_9678 [Anabarilius grahami]|uniref:Uncharacterized protein n=1 Tax=Anabarilius grahami TaxID=495550 RepID=A0A3N0Y3I9_ANAGA|nr:hypothetical protein DPX16_9678 [Anabarilius grahami]
MESTGLWDIKGSSGYIYAAFKNDQMKVVKVCGACIYAGFAEDRFKGTMGALMSTLQSVKMLNGTAYGLYGDRKST